jgi:hypothetical protein
MGANGGKGNQTPVLLSDQHGGRTLKLEEFGITRRNVFQRYVDLSCGIAVGTRYQIIAKDRICHSRKTCGGKYRHTAQTDADKFPSTVVH